MKCESYFCGLSSANSQSHLISMQITFECVRNIKTLESECFSYSGILMPFVICFNSVISSSWNGVWNLQPFGVLHGGITAYVAESLASMGAQLAANGARPAGVEMNVAHLQAVPYGHKVMAKAVPIRVGKRIQVQGRLPLLLLASWRYILLHTRCISFTCLASAHWFFSTPFLWEPKTKA